MPYVSCPHCGLIVHSAAAADTWPHCPACDRKLRPPAAETPPRASASFTTRPPSSVGGTSFRLPPNVPMAVRTALTTTTSRLILPPEVFERRAAEEWLGDRWTELVEDGVESVALVGDAGEVYRMSLAATETPGDST